MDIFFEIIKLLEERPSARRIVEYLHLRKAATVYQIAEAIREKPSEFEEDLSTLQRHDVVQAQMDAPESAFLEEPMYTLTGFGHEVAATAARGQAKS